MYTPSHTLNSKVGHWMLCWGRGSAGKEGFERQIFWTVLCPPYFFCLLPATSSLLSTLSSPSSAFSSLLFYCQFRDLTICLLIFYDNHVCKFRRASLARSLSLRLCLCLRLPLFSCSFANWHSIPNFKLNSSSRPPRMNMFVKLRVCACVWISMYVCVCMCECVSVSERH